MILVLLAATLLLIDDGQLVKSVTEISIRDAADKINGIADAQVDGNYLFSNPWHDEMVVSAEGIKSGDELIGKCVYTSLVHFDGLYYVNTELYPKNKGVYTKWAKTV